MAATPSIRTPRNIFIIGPQSTGKTTLVMALQECFMRQASISPDTVIPTTIKEVARTVLKKYHFTRDDITSSPSRALELQQHIMHAQLNAESAVVSQPASHWFISDRSGIDPIVYARIFAGLDSAQDLMDTAAWAQLRAGMKNGRVFLCEAGWSWLVDDGTRLVPDSMEEWLKVDAMFRDLLEANEIPYVLIPKHVTDTAERVKMVLSVLEDKGEERH